MSSKGSQLAGDAIRTDRQLWEAVVNDSTSAFAVLFDRYWSTIYRTAFSYVRNKEQSEEITHDIFINLWRRRHVLDIQLFSAYLRAAARYHVFKCMRVAKSSMVDYTDDWELIGTPSVENGGDERIRRAEFEEDIDNILVDLPARCKEIFLLSRRENLSNYEIADRLGISKRSVENQITRALSHLRIHLKTIATWLVVCFIP
ncbi:sigma-70 family RNA polymerase sigma factor [Parapedobacter tibetensis]|uniref:sigma-70 family RNA polymerase sigma factor n=1 Tax=Parapedobacter tibetensis TaxID=2972951 RepID=UPI00214D755E|nr:sigma-70 family RNA polymerase sigma factor [Parapedobacter tibetensis]